MHEIYDKLAKDSISTEGRDTRKDILFVLGTAPRKRLFRFIKRQPNGDRRLESILPDKGEGFVVKDNYFANKVKVLNLANFTKKEVDDLKYVFEEDYLEVLTKIYKTTKADENELRKLFEEKARKYPAKDLTKEFDMEARWKNPWEPTIYEEKTMLEKTIETNKTAAANVAYLTAGKTLNTLVANKLLPLLPENVQVYALTPLGQLVLANIASSLVQIAPGTKAVSTEQLETLTGAMIESAMLDVVNTIKIDQLISEFLSAEGVSNLLDSVKEV